MRLRIGEKVTLNTPENPTLHNKNAVVRILTAYGAVVFCEASKTKQFRALFAEMEPVNQASVGEIVALPEIKQGYSGNVCGRCGGLRMKRTGTCVTCEDCGENEGCG